MEKEKAQDGGVQPTEEKPVVDENAAPAEEEIVGENEDLSEYGVPPLPAEEEEKEEEKKPEEKPAVTPPEKAGEEPEKEAEVPPITPPEPRPTRLDKRLAKVYIQNCLMTGEENVPTEEQILADLKNYSKEDKIASLNNHLAERRRLRGEKPAENNFEAEDIEAIRDAERESIRQEILAEENERKVKENFVQFIGSHPELLPENKEYSPKIAKAVETLWRGGMPINEAFETVTESISSAKADEKKEAEIKKQKALSGAVSASNDSARATTTMTWEEFDELRTKDPARYEKLLDEGFEPSDE